MTIEKVDRRLLLPVLMGFMSPAVGVESSRNHRNTIVGRKFTADCCAAGNSSPIRARR